jgi:hypothetical protein
VNKKEDGDDKEGDGDDKEETELSWVYWFPVFTGMTKKEMGMTLSSHSRASRFSFPQPSCSLPRLPLLIPA